MAFAGSNVSYEHHDLKIKIILAFMVFNGPIFIKTLLYLLKCLARK